MSGVWSRAHFKGRYRDTILQWSLPDGFSPFYDGPGPLGANFVLANPSQMYGVPKWWRGGVNFGDLLFVFLIANFLPAGLGTLEKGDCLPYSPHFRVCNSKYKILGHYRQDMLSRGAKENFRGHFIHKNA